MRYYQEYSILNSFSYIVSIFIYILEAICKRNSSIAPGFLKHIFLSF